MMKRRCGSDLRTGVRKIGFELISNDSGRIEKLGPVAPVTSCARIFR